MAAGARRKDEHLRICAEEDVESHGNAWTRGGHRWALAPDPLPNLHIEEVDLSQTFLGRRFGSPFLIAGMTGGVEKGQWLNHVLGEAAQRLNIPMGLGSMRLLFEDPSLKKHFDLRPSLPNIFLIGNLGAVSLNMGVTPLQVARLAESLQLNAFALHLNALQEAVQPEGNRDFRDLLKKIAAVVKECPVPVILKEVGSGILPQSLTPLLETGVAAIDVGGSGGTSWSVVEGHRGGGLHRRLGELFRNWGVGTAHSLSLCRSWLQKPGNHMPAQYPLVATGGVRDGWQGALLVALGATMVGVGLPLMRAALTPAEGLTPEEAVDAELNFFLQSLRIAMFCSGCRTLGALPSRLVEREGP